MKKTLFALGMLAVLGVNTVEANDYNSNGYSQDCCYDESKGFYVGADLLYWTAYKSDQDYVVQNFSDGSIQNSKDAALQNGARANMYFAEYDWDAGFRVFAGYESRCNNFDARIAYLYFSTDDDNQANFGGPGDTDEHLKPTLWSPSFDNDRCCTATAKPDLEYHLFDVTVGRTCCICDGFELRPFGGFRALVLDQELKVVYSGGRDFSQDQGYVNWSSEFTGYGLTGGFDWNLRFCDSFSAFGGVAASVLGGETDDYETQSGPEGTSGGSVNFNNINVREEQFIGVTGYQLALGLAYEKYCDFGCGCTGFKLGLGYEMNHWFNVPEVRRYVGYRQEAANTGGARGCLLLHGLVLRGAVSF